MKLIHTLASSLALAIIFGCGNAGGAGTASENTGAPQGTTTTSHHSSSGMDGLYIWTYYGANGLDTNTMYIQGNKVEWNPKGGVDPFDFDAAAKSDPENTGTFKVDGDQMAIQWAGKPAQSWKLEYENGKLSHVNGGIVSKVDAYSDNQKLDATYSGILLAGGKVPGLGERSLAAGRSMTFAPDGIFSVSLGATTDLNSNVVGGNPSVSSEGGGKYMLTGNTLVLTFADGHEERHTVFPWSTAIDKTSAKMSDEKLFLDTMMLDREK